MQQLSKLHSMKVFITIFDVPSVVVRSNLSKLLLPQLLGRVRNCWTQWRHEWKGVKHFLTSHRWTILTDVWQGFPYQCFAYSNNKMMIQSRYPATRSRAIRRRMWCSMKQNERLRCSPSSVVLLKPYDLSESCTLVWQRKWQVFRVYVAINVTYIMGLCISP